MKKFLQMISILMILFYVTGCSNPAMFNSSSREEVFTGYETEHNKDGKLIAALEAEQIQRGKLGNPGDPDHALEGTLWYITAAGTVSSINYDRAVVLAGQHGWVGANGSLNTLNDAKSSFKQVAAKLNKNIVLVYIAQGIDYWNAEDSRFKSVFSDLVNDVTRSGKKLTTVSSSWSGHIVTRIVRDNSKVCHFSVNPAHGNFKKGEEVKDYVSDLKRAKAKIYILTGKDDIVTTEGGGSAYKVWWGIKGYNSVYYAIRDNSNVNLYLVNNCGHSLTDMIKKGAADKMLRYTFR